MKRRIHAMSAPALYVLAFAALTILSCSHAKRLPAIGETLPDDVPTRSESFMIMTSASSFDEVYDLTRNGIEYHIAVNDDQRIVYIGTGDPDFTTAEGIKIGTPLQEVLESTDSKLCTEPGWAHCVRLNSGWYAAFAVGESMTDSLPDNDHGVDWFFKRQGL